MNSILYIYIKKKKIKKKEKKEENKVAVFPHTFFLEI